MRVAYGLPFLSSPPQAAFLAAGAVGRLAAAAEQAGFDAAFLTDHPAPSQAWRQGGGHDSLDPFVGLAFAASATTTLRVMTNLAVAPYRNPFLLAKAAATLDALSGGRLILGLGAGYLKSEFRALGVDFDTRNDRFDEVIEVVKLAWTGEPVSVTGASFSARDTTVQPVPIQQPHPPLWFGGNSKLTRRRVVEHGQGWMPLPNRRATAGRLHSPPLETVDDLAELLAYLRINAERVGRATAVDVMWQLDPVTEPADLRRHRDLANQLGDLGVTWLAINGQGRSMGEAMDFIGRYGQGVVAQCR